MEAISSDSSPCASPQTPEAPQDLDPDLNPADSASVVAPEHNSTSCRVSLGPLVEPQAASAEADSSTHRTSGLEVILGLDSDSEPDKAPARDSAPSPTTPLDFEAQAAESFHEFFLGFFNTILYKKANIKSSFFATTRLFNLGLGLTKDPKVSGYLDECSRRAARLVLANEVDEVKLNVNMSSGLVLQQFVVKVGGEWDCTVNDSDSADEHEYERGLMLEGIRIGLRQILATLSDDKTIIPVPVHEGGYFDIKMYDPGQALIDSIFQNPTVSTPHVNHIHVAILVKRLFFNVYVLTFAPLIPDSNPCSSSTVVQPMALCQDPTLRDDPAEQLLRNLSPLLDPQTGGISSHLHIPIMVSLMRRFGTKIVSRCTYINILHSTAPQVLHPFMTQGGWDLMLTWVHESLWKNNYKMVEELLFLLHRVQVNAELLGSNWLAELVNDMTKHTHRTVKMLAKRIHKNWKTVVKVA